MLRWKNFLLSHRLQVEVSYTFRSSTFFRLVEFRLICCTGLATHVGDNSKTYAQWKPRVYYDF